MFNDYLDVLFREVPVYVSRPFFYCYFSIALFIYFIIDL